MLCNIGSIQLQRQDYKSSIESFTKALKRQEESYGSCHPLVVTTLDNLGFAHCKVKDYDSALKIYEKKLQSETAHFGRWNMQCCHTMMKKNVILEKQKDYSGALKGTVTVLALQKQFLLPDDPSIRDTHNMLERLEIKCRRPSCEVM
jgi:tetratricopeptide (TPR) repeat protein